MKMLCFREQFEMNIHELRAIKCICLFTVAWFTAPIMCNASYKNLCVLQNIEMFKTVGNKIAQVALKKMTGHLWCISKDSAALSLFSDKVFANKKRMIVAALSTPESKPD